MIDYIFYKWYTFRKGSFRTPFDVWVYLLTSYDCTVDTYRKEFYKKLNGEDSGLKT